MGHPINGVWSTLALYRDTLPEAEREKFVGLTVRELLAQPVEEWITRDIAVSLSEEECALLEIFASSS
jgi:hypothetical protein